MAGVDSLTPSPTTGSPSGFNNCQPFPWPAVNSAGRYNRSVSEHEATPTSRQQQHNSQYGKWRTALRCKQHVGTKEWINCKQTACQDLREELHHLLECRYRLAGGCKERCVALREELKKFEELIPKYRSVSEKQLKTQCCRPLINDELQAKLQVLTIKDYVASAAYSPTSPFLDEPFQSKFNESAAQLVPVVVLVPLVQTQLSVRSGTFRKGKEWEKLTFLGKGTFGSTYLCRDKHKESFFAIKKLPVSSFNKDEVRIWQKLMSGRHPNILELYGAVEREQRVLIFMEYMDGGSVGDYLAKNGKLSERNALQILQDVLKGLDYMHRRRIIHGDVKAANILMDCLGLKVKLADFGMCMDLSLTETGAPQRLAGTLAFMAPEVCRSEAPAPSSDIWSTLCFLIQMLTAEAPWEEYRHQGDGLLYVIGSAKRPPRLPRCSEQVQEIFSQGLNVTASERATAAGLLRHRVFNLSKQFDGDAETSFLDHNESASTYRNESAFQVENETHSPTSDSSTVYHSSHSPDTSAEFFSLDEEKSEDAKHCNERNMKRRIASKGGQLRLANALVTIPAGALPTDTTLAITSIHPGQFYQAIIDNGIQDKVTILGDAFKLRPSGQKFRENVNVKVILPEGLHQSEDLRILHGTFGETHKLTWMTIDKTSSELSFEDSATVTVAINHFSVLLFVKSLSTFAYEYITTCFNTSAALFRFIVLTRLEDSKRLAVRVVAVRDSFYCNTNKEIFKEHYICHKLKEEGFSEMYGSRREYVHPKETIAVRIEKLHDEVVDLKKDYTVLNVFGGEEVARWVAEIKCEFDQISGAVVMRRVAGQKYRFQFWQHEPTKFVQDVFKLRELRYTNMLPLARAVGLDQGELDNLVEETGGDEEKQLQTITECWMSKAENNELLSFEKFVTSVPREAILVSDRGKSHLGHLSEFRQKWDEGSQTAPLGEDLHVQTMAEFGAHICESVFSDCLLQTDSSNEAISIATNRNDRSFAMKPVLNVMEKNYPARVMKKLGELVEVFVSYDESRVAFCQRFCQRLYDSVPWLMQVVKDIFKVLRSTFPTGMWGLKLETERCEESNEEKSCVDVWCDIVELLRKLCDSNLTDSSQVEDLCSTLNVSGLLDKLSISDKEWLCLAARVKYYHRFLKEIMKRELSRIHSQDLSNVFHCMQRYVSFCPTRLVHFSFSKGKVQKESLAFDETSNVFTQKCAILDDDVLNLIVKVEVYIKGTRLSGKLGAINVKRCELVQNESDAHGRCTTLIVAYKHQVDRGLLKIKNECRSVDHELTVVHVEREEGADQADGNSKVVIKEGCPDQSELDEIATKVTNEWKPLGRLLLSRTNAVVNIDADERGIEEKTTKMFQKWKQSQGSNATYKKLYEALLHSTVDRRDIAEQYCIAGKAQAEDTVL